MTVRAGKLPFGQSDDDGATDRRHPLDSFGDRSLRFPGGELRLHTRELWIRGERVPIGGRAFDLLHLLVKQPGKIVSKDELLHAAWGHEPVGDANLHVQISRLRQYLGRDSIRTVPGRGYMFSVLRTMEPSASTPTNPKRAGVTLFGRDEDIRALHALFQQHRVVAITGAGGIGKTTAGRAVLEASNVHAQDAYAEVDLTTVASADEIPAAIAAALALGGDPPRSAAALVARARCLEATVFLDNADLLVRGIERLLGSVVPRSPGLRFLITTQAPLRASWVRNYKLDALEVPPADANLEAAMRFPAFALLLDRIRAADRHFAIDPQQVTTASDICRHLDGVPLAIELVAPRCAALGMSAVRDQLNRRFRAFADPDASRDTRQRTLSAVMEWSYALLSASQRTVFRRLGVFAGGFGLALAEMFLECDSSAEESAPHALTELVEHSLVTTEHGGGKRYRLLETARLYALECLTTAGEIEAVRNMHTRAVTQLMDRAYADFWEIPEAAFVEQYGLEIDNLRVALAWALKNDGVAAVALAASSGPVWRCLSLHSEGVRLLSHILTLPEAEASNEKTARLCVSIALLHGESASVEGRGPARRAAALYRQLGDDRGRYLALSLLAYSYRYIEGEEACRALDELRHLQRPDWPPLLRLFGARIEAPKASHAERVREGRAVNERRLALANAAGSVYEANCALVNLADLALMDGESDEAVRLNRLLLERLSQRHMASRIIVLGNLLGALVLSRAIREARAAAEDFFQAASRLDFMFGLFAVDALGLLAALELRWAAAAHFLGYSDYVYAQKHRQRGDNELLIREQLWNLLTSHVHESDLLEWMTRGKSMDAHELHRLALLEEVPTDPLE